MLMPAQGGGHLLTRGVPRRSQRLGGDALRPRQRQAHAGGQEGLTLPSPTDPLVEDAGNSTGSSCDLGQLPEAADAGSLPAGGRNALAPEGPLHMYSYSIAYSLSYGEPVLYFEATDASGAPLARAQVLADLCAGAMSLPPDFDAADASGTPLARDQALADLCAGALSSPPSPREVRGSLGAAAVVSQEEHPVLRRPMWMLHPCQTGAVMQLLTEGVDSTSATSSPAGSGGSHSQGLTAARVVANTEPPPAEVEVSPLRYLMAWWSVQAQVVGLPLPVEAWQAALAGP